MSEKEKELPNLWAVFIEGHYDQVREARDSAENIVSDYADSLCELYIPAAKIRALIVKWDLQDGREGFATEFAEELGELLTDCR